MTTGDILSLEVLPDGYSGLLTIDDFVTGATFALGSPLKGVLTVPSLGHDATGATVVVPRVVKIRFIAYVEPPPANSFATDQTEVGATLVVRVVFNRPIYEKDAGIEANIAAGLVINSGGGLETSHAAVTLAVTNSSQLQYPKCVGRWLSMPYSGNNDQAAAVLGAGDFNVDLQAFSKWGVACVKVTLQDGTVTRETTLTSMDWRAELNAASYRRTDQGSNFTQSAGVVARARIFPRIGDSTEILDSNAIAFADSYAFANLPLGVCDKGGTYGVTFCAVNSSTGNDTTGVASATRATAEATPCATIGGAMVKIAAFNNTTYSRNTVDAGVICLIGGGHLYGRGGSTPATHSGTSVTITRATGTTRAAAQITGFNATSRYGAQHTRIYDCSIVPSSGPNQQIGWVINGSTVVVSDVTMTGTGAGTAPFDHDTTGKGAHWWCRVTMTGYTNGFSTANGMVGVACVNCSTDAASAFAGVRCVAGCLASNATSKVWQLSGFAWTNTGNCIMSWTQAPACEGDFMPSELRPDSDVFVVCCLAERVGASPTALVDASSDELGGVRDNVQFIHCTLVGNRTNIEADISLAAGGLVDGLMSNYGLRHSVVSFLAVQSHSDDAAMTMIGNRAFQYGLVIEHVHEEDEVLGFAPWAHDGWTQDSAAGFVNDASRTGSDTGNGDYTPNVGSILRNRVPAGERLIPCDLFGTPVPDDGTAAIGAVQVPVPPVTDTLVAGSLMLLGVGR